MDENQFKIISEKMDRLAAIISTQSIENSDKKIYIMKRIGMKSKDIGNLLGVTEGRIRQSKGWKRK